MWQEEEIAKKIYKELKGFKNGSILGFLASIFFLFSPFLTWPGFGSDIFWSPLDIFILKKFDLWFLVLVSFILGIAVEILPAWMSVYLYTTRLFPEVLKDRVRGFSYHFKEIFIGLIFSIPLLILLFSLLCFKFNLVAFYLLMYLAQLKGYQGEYYREYMGIAVGEWFTSGVIFCISTAFFFLTKILKRKYKFTQNLEIT